MPTALPEHLQETVVGPILEQLKPYQGQPVMIWSYRHAHHQIAIRVGDDPFACVYLVCDECRNIQGPLDWKN